MVTSFLLTKLVLTKRDIDINKHYNDVYKTLSDKNISITSCMCRICLKEGKISIFSNENCNDILKALDTLANIRVVEGDEYPKYLCNICFRFITEAILFRKIVKLTENVLIERAKESLPDVDFEKNCNIQFELKEKSPVARKTDIKNVHVKCKTNKSNVSDKIQCNICDKIVNRSYYKEHVTMHDSNQNKYICDICGKSFRLRCAYHNHSLRHSNDFTYKCQFCPYKGRYAELLKTHMRTHTGDYRYMCTECPARFLFKSNLNSHMFKHKVPQFKCEACKKAFHTNILLKRHFDADHLGIKNNVCNMCGKAFGYRNAMMKHQRHVHKREKLLFARMPSYLKAENSNFVSSI